MENTKITKVSETAINMAAVRACESMREDALFIDRFAEKLVGPEAIAKAIPLVEEYEKQGRPFGEVRTRFLDDFLLNNVVHIRQIVILGAGFDSRAFRLKLPKYVRFFEVDQQEIIDQKNNILADEIPQCDRRTVAANLGDSAWVDLLLDAGFQPQEPTIWILEGFIYYLTEPQALNLMEKINNLSAVGSCLGCDLINSVVCNGKDEWASMWHFGCDEPEKFFANFGWVAKAVQPDDPEANYGRFTFKFPSREDLEGFHIFFTTAVKES